MYAPFGQPNGINAKRFQKTICYLAIRPWAVDIHCAAVHQRQAAAQCELIALGMAAEIVVIIENENARRCVHGAVEVCSGEPADATANDDEIVDLIRIGDLAALGPEITIAQTVSALEASGMISPQTRQRRRIVSGSILRDRSAG